MNETIVPTTDFVWRRLDHPIKPLGYEWQPWAWWVIVISVISIGLVYVAWMYVRDSKSIGPWWGAMLGFCRTCVYLLLGFVFMLPAWQTWYTVKQSSRVVVLFDTSLSISNTRDDTPPEGQKFADMPTRQDKVIKFLEDKVNGKTFFDRLNETNPVVGYRFGRQLDPDFRYITTLANEREHRFWSRGDWEKRQTAKPPDEVPPPGLPTTREHLLSWLTPLSDDKLPGGWDRSEPRSVEFLRQLKNNQTQVAARFFDGTAVGESLQEVIKQERNNMLQGIVVFTDGRSNDGSSQAIRDVAVAARDANIPIFVVSVGEDRKKVAIDIVDVRVPPIVRPDDKFRVIVSVNGQDMPNEAFEIELDVTRFVRGKDGTVTDKDIELVPLDPKGQIIDGAAKISLGKKVTLKTKDAKTPPRFSTTGTPPNAQVEFEVDASVLAKAAGKAVDVKAIGIAPDDLAEIRFVARVPRDKREVTDLTEHVSDPAEMRVQKKPLRVLLFTSVASREYMFLRTLLVREAEKGRAEICILLQNIPGGEKRTGLVQDVDASRLLTHFPTKGKASQGEKDPFYSLSAYDVIISFDANWFELSEEQKKMVSDWVYKDGGGLIFVGGGVNTQEMARPNLQKEIQTVLNMLPVVLEDARKEDQETDVARRLVFPQASAEMEFMRLDEADRKEEWKKGWDRFFNEIRDEDGKVSTVDPGGPPALGFYSYFPSKKVKENALVMASYDSPTAVLRGTTDKQPFLASGPWGEGKVFWMASGEMWRLRNYSEGYHERFWTKLIADVGSKSVNTINKRITPILSRTGTKDKYHTFEARFEDLNGKPLNRVQDPPPKLHVILPEGVVPQKGDTVNIKDGEHTGKQGKVTEVIVTKEGDQEVRKLRLAGVPGVEAGTTLEIDSRKVELTVPPLNFKPKLTVKKDESPETADDLNKKNDGWFKIEFQPRATGEYKLKVAYEDSQDNVYNHKFIVKESNPELDNVRPDLETLYALASDAKPVLNRISGDAQRRLREVLKKPEGLKEEGKEGEPKPAPVKGEDDEESLRLYFDLESAKVIPSCMVSDRKEYKNRGKVDDVWDAGFTVWRNPEVKLSCVLVTIVLLLSTEWLTRKLLRLA